MLFRHRHDAAVARTSVLDNHVGQLPILLHGLRLPAEEPGVEGGRPLGLAALKLVPGQAAGVVDPARPDVLPRLPGCEHGARRVLDNSHPAGVENVERLAVDRAAQLARPRSGRAGVLDAHVVEPVRRDTLLAPPGFELVEAADLVATQAQHRVRPRLPGRHVLRLPAEQLAVKGLGAYRIRRRQVHPAEGPRLVMLPLAHPFLLPAASSDRPKGRAVSLRRPSRFPSSKRL